jgi:catechol 2,3-dioxygenase-like lactoylglutathione lyase family enzyme
MFEHALPFTLDVVTLGVKDFARSVRFYGTLGLLRKMRATGDEIAFFDAGGVVLALFRWNMLAEDAALPVAPHPDGFRGATFAHMCRSDQEVDAVMARALGIGARLLKPAQKPRSAAIPAISPIPTATPGRSCARRASRSPTTGGWSCRNRAFSGKVGTGFRPKMRPRKELDHIQFPGKLNVV